jgi:hypothetical protein
MSISIEKIPSLRDMDVFWELVDEEALPMSMPDFRAKKESNIEFRGVAENLFKIIILK